MKILFATKNEGKLREIREILGPDYEVLSLLDLAEVPEIVEDGTSFEENALIKVRAIGPQKDTVVLADDSGLCIDAFSGGPGVYSSRFLGEDTDYIFKNNYILEKLSGLPDEQRGAHYSCVIAALFPDGTEAVTEARMEGIISEKPMGSGGFGYDPILYLPAYEKTSAELTAEEKNAISHRGKALRAMKKMIEERWA